MLTGHAAIGGLLNSFIVSGGLEWLVVYLSEWSAPHYVPWLVGLELVAASL
jgi:hypothetical protein